MRTDPRRLDLGLYPFTVEIPPRFNDMDALRHLNNVALAAVYEEGRIALHRATEIDDMREKGTRTVVAQVNITYIGEGLYPDTLHVGGGISRIGSASYTIVQGLFQKGRCIGVCDTVIVNTRDHRAHSMTEGYRQALSRLRVDLGDDGHG